MDSTGSTVEEPEGLKTPPSTPNKQSETLKLQYLHHLSPLKRQIFNIHPLVQKRITAINLVSLIHIL